MFEASAKQPPPCVAEANPILARRALTRAALAQSRSNRPKFGRSRPTADTTPIAHLCRESGRHSGETARHLIPGHRLDRSKMLSERLESPTIAQTMRRVAAPKSRSLGQRLKKLPLTSQAHGKSRG